MLLLGSCDMFPPDSVKGLYARSSYRVNSAQLMGMDRIFRQGREDNDVADEALIVLPEPFRTCAKTLQSED